MRPIRHPGSPTTGAHYSPALQVGETVYLSGQLPLDPVSRQRCGDTIEAQTRKALENMEALLQQAGGDRNSIVRTTAYIPDIALWDKVNEVYADFFRQHMPARSIIVVKEIHFGCLIEIDGIAVVNTSPGSEA